MLNFDSPDGVSTVISSPAVLPKMALPTGDSIEISPLIGLASALLTNV